MNNQTVANIFDPEEVANYQPMFANAREIRDFAGRVHEVSPELVEPAAVKPKAKATETAVNDDRDLPTGGQQNSPRTVTGIPRGQFSVWPLKSTTLFADIASAGRIDARQRHADRTPIAQGRRWPDHLHFSPQLKWIKQIWRRPQ